MLIAVFAAMCTIILSYKYKAVHVPVIVYRTIYLCSYLLFIYLSLSVYLSISIYLSIYLSIYPSIHPSWLSQIARPGVSNIPRALGRVAPPRNLGLYIYIYIEIGYRVYRGVLGIPTKRLDVTDEAAIKRRGECTDCSTRQVRPKAITTSSRV